MWSAKHRIAHTPMPVACGVFCRLHSIGLAQSLDGCVCAPYRFNFRDVSGAGINVLITYPFWGMAFRHGHAWSMGRRLRIAHSHTRFGAWLLGMGMLGQWGAGFQNVQQSAQNLVKLSMLTYNGCDVVPLAGSFLVYRNVDLVYSYQANAFGCAPLLMDA